MGSDKMGYNTTPISEPTPPAYQSTDPMATTPEILENKQPTRREGMVAQNITNPKAAHIQHKMDSTRQKISTKMDNKRQKISTKMDAKQQKINKKMTKLQREVDDEGYCNWACHFGGLSCGRPK